MFRTLSATVVAAALCAGMAQAQSEETTTETPGDPAAEGLALGEPVAAELQVGDTYRVEAFTDWELRCIVAAEGSDPCQLYQLLRDADGNAVAEFTIFPLPPGRQAVAGGTVITPLETLLPAQLRISVDGGQAKQYPYSFCSQIGCFARIGLTEDEIVSFRAGSEATVAITPAAAPDEIVALAVSLSGFTAGFEALQDRASRE